MRPTLLAATLVALSATAAAAQARIGEVSTNWQAFGPDDKVVVERYDDPRVGNVSCYPTFSK